MWSLYLSVSQRLYPFSTNLQPMVSYNTVNFLHCYQSCNKEGKMLLHLRHFYFIKSLSNVKNAHTVTLAAAALPLFSPLQVQNEIMKGVQELDLNPILQLLNVC